MIGRCNGGRPNPSQMHRATDIASLLPPVLALGQQAADAIMQVYSTAFTVDFKADASPLTVADRQAHEILSAGLARLTLGIPVLSEESPAEIHAYETRRRWSEHWLVDPLDGTKEFVNRNGEFTVNIALIREHRPVFGVVIAPALNLTYYAGEDLGAWCIREPLATPERIAVRRPAADPPVIAASRSHRDAALDALLARLGRYECRSVGSALKFCLVAQGSVDFYPRLGPTSEWDTAAGQAIVEYAGGDVTEITGLPLRYNRRETLLNPHFLAFGDSSRQWHRLLVPESEVC